MKDFVSLIGSISILFLSACDSDKIEPQDQLVLRQSSEHFDFYAAASDGDRIDVKWQEEYYSWLMKELAIDSPLRMEFHKYKNRNHLHQITGKSTNGFAEVGTVKFHTIWYADNHECVHTVVINLIGHPPALFNEGIAVAHQADYGLYPDFIPGWNGKDFHELSREYLENDEIPDLNSLLLSESFWDFDANKTYALAGSFVTYLIDQHGLDAIKKYFGNANFEDGKDATKSKFQRAFDSDIQSEWANWKTFLSTYP